MKFPEFLNSRKKGQPWEVDQNFRNEFPETFYSIPFWTEISGTLVERNASCFFMKQIEFMLPCVCLGLDDRWRQTKRHKNTSDTLGYRLVCYIFAPTTFWHHLDLLLNRRTARWNLFAKYNYELPAIIESARFDCLFLHDLPSLSTFYHVLI